MTYDEFQNQYTRWLVARNAVVRWAREYRGAGWRRLLRFFAADRELQALLRCEQLERCAFEALKEGV